MSKVDEFYEEMKRDEMLAKKQEYTGTGT